MRYTDQDQEGDTGMYPKSYRSRTTAIIAVTAVMAISCLAMPICSFAAEETAITEAQSDKMTQEQRNIAIQKGQEYISMNATGTGEDKDYTYMDSDRAGTFDEDEYRRTLSAQPAESLTQRQKDEGWALIDGMAYPPNNLDGDMGETLRGEMDIDPETAGYVTFVANTDPGMTETIYVGITNTETFESYAYTMEAVNGYTTTVPVPPGCYIIMEGGPVNDTTARYAVSESTFTIDEAETKTVKFRVADRMAQFNKHKETEEETTEEVSEEAPAAEEPVKEEKKFNVVLFIVSIVMIIIFIAGGIYAFKHYLKNDLYR